MLAESGEWWHDLLGEVPCFVDFEFVSGEIPSMEGPVSIALAIALANHVGNVMVNELLFVLSFLQLILHHLDMRLVLAIRVFVHALGELFRDDKLIQFDLVFLQLLAQLF